MNKMFLVLLLCVSYSSVPCLLHHWYMALTADYLIVASKMLEYVLSIFGKEMIPLKCMNKCLNICMYLIWVQFMVNSCACLGMPTTSVWNYASQFCFNAGREITQILHMRYIWQVVNSSLLGEESRISMSWTAGKYYVAISCTTCDGIGLVFLVTCQTYF